MDRPGQPGCARAGCPSHRWWPAPSCPDGAHRRKDIGVDRILALGTARVSRLELLPFEERQVAALVASYLGIDRADDALVRRIVALSDETPLGALEVLGALLDAGAVRPKLGAWIYEPARADRVALPTGALALLGRRLKELPPATRAVLEMGAIIGATFPDDLLARVVGLDLGDLGYGLADARRAGLIEVEASGHRFVHDSLRETLLASLGSSERRSIHQRVAEALDDAGDTSFETRCAVALHYADGELTRAPMRAYQAARAAANVALERFDNETVLRFLDLARGRRGRHDPARRELPPHARGGTAPAGGAGREVLRLRGRPRDVRRCPDAGDSPWANLLGPLDRRRAGAGVGIP